MNPTATTLPAQWATNWSHDTQRSVIECGDITWSRCDIDARTGDTAGKLAAAGVSKGDRVLLVLASRLDFIEFYVAALRIGAIVMPGNPGFGRDELVHVCNDGTPQLVVADSPHVGQWLASAASVASPDEVRDTVGIEVALGTSTPDDPALLPYTSGTTGRPKGALLSHGNLFAGVAALIEAWRWTELDRLLLVLPLFHMHGLGVGLNGSLAAGSSILLHESFDVDAVLDCAERGSMSMFFGVPTMYYQLAEHPRLSVLQTLRLCVSGSAPLDAAVHETVSQRSGQRILERYGLTETLMNLSNPYDLERRPGTVGFALPGVEVRTSTDDRNEIEVRGPNVFQGYWQNEQATADAFTEDGWFRTGDVGFIDDDGYWRIVGRLKELIITGGYNVYPREIEDALNEIGGVEDCAVVGTPDPKWGEIVTAYIVRSDRQLSSENIATAMRDQLVDYKQPRLITFVEAIPRNALGKIVRAQVATAEPETDEPA